MPGILTDYIRTAFYIGVGGFAWGTGIYLFAWMIRQGYSLFRKIALSA